MEMLKKSNFAWRVLVLTLLFLGMCGLFSLSSIVAVAQDLPMVQIRDIPMPPFPIIPTNVGGPDIFRPPQMVNIQTIQIRMILPSMPVFGPTSLEMVQPTMITPAMIEPSRFPSFQGNIGGYTPAPSAGLPSGLFIRPPTVSSGLSSFPGYNVYYLQTWSSTVSPTTYPAIYQSAQPVTRWTASASENVRYRTAGFRRPVMPVFRGSVGPPAIQGAVPFGELSSGELKRQGFGNVPTSNLEKQFFLEKKDRPSH